MDAAAGPLLAHGRQARVTAGTPEPHLVYEHRDAEQHCQPQQNRVNRGQSAESLGPVADHPRLGHIEEDVDEPGGATKVFQQLLQVLIRNRCPSARKMSDMMKRWKWVLSESSVGSLGKSIRSSLPR